MAVRLSDALKYRIIHSFLVSEMVLSSVLTKEKCEQLFAVFCGRPVHFVSVIGGILMTKMAGPEICLVCLAQNSWRCCLVKKISAQ